MSNHTGRCLCGSVTYSFQNPIKWCGHCQCESCRRNCAAPITTFIAVCDGQWEWTGGEPGVYESSPGVKRFFCRDCGTPMGFRPARGGEIHVYAAGLDDPEAFQPQVHFFYSERLSWLTVADDLPKHD